MQHDAPLVHAAVVDGVVARRARLCAKLLDAPSGACRASRAWCRARAVADCRARAAKLLHWLLDERRYRVVWTRTPANAHASGFEFPATPVEPLWAGLTTHRVRLRKEREARIDGPGFQALQESELAPSRAAGAALALGRGRETPYGVCLL